MAQTMRGCPGCLRNRGHRAGCPLKSGDPDVRRLCAYCAGAIYSDEPAGCVCVNCLWTAANIHAAHDETVEPKGPRVARVVTGPRPREHGYRLGTGAV